MSIGNKNKVEFNYYTLFVYDSTSVSKLYELEPPLSNNSDSGNSEMCLTLLSMQTSLQKQWI